VERNWKGLEEEREKWTGIICEILRHAEVVGNVQQDEAERAIQTAKAGHARAFASAKDGTV
jgi:hypothetical protein